MEAQAQAPRRLAYIVDDEREVRVALSCELKAEGIEARPFASAADFLEEVPYLRPGCLILDVRMPGKNGVELLAELVQLGIRWPAIMITGHAEVITAVQAMKLGAVEFLEKPFSDEALLAALDRGFAMLEATSWTVSTRQRAQTRLQKLTPREREVLMGVIEGMSNKLIAVRLDLSHRTVEMHRSNLMRKLEVAGITELLGVAAQAGISSPFAADLRSTRALA